MKTQLNPLLKASELKHRAIDFPKIQPEHFMPAIEEAIRQARENIHRIEKSPSKPDFDNTIVALELSSEKVDLVANVFYNLLGSQTNEKLQKIAQEFGPKISDFSSDIILNEKLFARIQSVWEQKDQLGLSQEEFQLLEKTYTDFVRNGAKLEESKKQRLREIDQKLSRLGPEYSENVLKATNAFEMLLENEDDLAGLPEGVREAAQHAAEEREKKGWLFNLQAPSMMGFLKYSEKRELREKIWKAYASRSFNDKFDNQKQVLEIIQLRHERAQLLGFKTHADFVLQKRMAESPEKVTEFLNKLLSASKPAAERDLKEVQALALEMGGPQPLMPWDFGYYSEKLKEKKFDINEEELRPYFKLENVIEGVFEHARRLFGLKFQVSTDYPVYHPDVKVYEVIDEKDSSFVGLFYTDFFPRDSKRGGAWMTNFFEQGLYGDTLMRPHVSIVCNFTKPTPKKPSLLTFDEVRTLFHEFGHSLHSLLSQCRFRSLSGTNVYWDFVELPSQILENWTLEKEALDLFARHFETGATIPKELTQKIIDSSKFLAGYSSLRQLNFAFLDMAWHSTDPKQIRDVDSFEKQVTQKTQLLPSVPGMNVSCAFSHIFAGGYSAGYYSYKWAEVLDADAFEYFKEKGIFDPEVSRKFKEHILSRGGTEHPMELYKRFRGREPDPEALLRRDGLI